MTNRSLQASRLSKVDDASLDHVHVWQVGLIDRLSSAGCGTIEAASFVSPKWIPQMADGREVMSQITRASGVRYAALTPNVRGLEAALEAGVDEVLFT